MQLAVDLSLLTMQALTISAIRANQPARFGDPSASDPPILT